MPFGTDFPTKDDLNRVLADDDMYQLYNSDLTFVDDRTERGKFRLVEFFENDLKKARILDTALNLAPLVIDTGTDFLFGEPVKITVEDDSDDKDETDVEQHIQDIVQRTGFMTKLSESSALFQSVGHTHFKIYAESVNGKTQACIEEVPYDYWFPNWSGVPLGQESKDVRLVVYLDNVDANNQVVKYIYIENYYLLPGETGSQKCVCAKSLWKDNNGKIGEQEALATLNLPVAPGAVPDALRPMTMIEDTGLTELPLVPIHVRKTVKERYGQSVLKKALPLIHQINDRLTQLSSQFLKHLNAKLQLPEGSVERDQRTGALKTVNLEVLLSRAGDPEAKYITNENPLIEQAFTHLDKLVSKVAKLTQTPASFLTDDEKGGVEKAESLRTRLMGFLKRIKLYQTRYDEAIKKILILALKVEGVKNADTLPIRIVFDPGLPKEWQADVTVWGDALSQGLASKETAVSRFQGIEKEELDEELARIDADAQEAMKTAMTLNPPKPVAADDGDLPQA